MKIKEVCARTGLTERAVRLYLEKGLLSPESCWRQGRTYREYGEEDVARLQEISALRSVGFSLEEIGALQRDGAQTNLLLQKRRTELREDAAAAEETARLLDGLPLSGWKDSGELARAILREGGPKRTADAQPDFGREDGLTREEKQALARRASERLKQTGRRQKWLRRGAAAAVCLLLLGGGLGFWRYRRDTQPLSLITFTGPAYFSEPAYAEAPDGSTLPAAWVTLPDAELRFLGIFREESGEALYGACIAGTEYPAVQIEIRIPRREAREMGLVEESTGLLNVQKVQETVLADSALCWRYLSVTGVQAEAKDGIPETISIPK